MTTVRNFLRQAYRLINPSNPTQPLHGDDESLGLLVTNQLLDSFASSGLLLTIAKSNTSTIQINQQFIVCGPPSFVPTPDIPFGRLSNALESWLILSGVSYPLIIIDKAEYLESFHYEPLQGLPRFLIVFQDTEVTNLRVYPSPSQAYQFYIRGKFQLAEFGINDDLSALPLYYYRFLLFSAAKDIAMYKGRADAWTDKLESMLQASQMTIEAATEVNLSITGDRQSLLNGAWRVRAGV